MKLNELDLHAVGNTIQLVGAVYADDSTMLLCLFPEDSGSFFDSNEGVIIEHVWFEPSSDPDGGTKVQVLDMDHEDWKTFLRQTDLLETEVLAQASDGTLAKVVLRKSQRQIDQNVSWRVFRRDDYTCRYCGRNDVPLTVDHLVLWEDGGPTIEDNLVAACRKCNKTRGRLPYTDWLDHGYYKRVSAGLDEQVRRANVELASTLDGIPRTVHKRSR